MKAEWQQGVLGDFVSAFIVPQRDKPKKFSGNIPWCRIEDIDGMWLSKSKSGKCVTDAMVQEMPLRVFPTGTVMVSCSADLGRCAIASQPLITNQTFIGLVPKPTLDPRFLYYLMSSKADALNAAATGATIKYLSQEKFRLLPVTIPKLGEQQRIVGILGEAFEGIAKARANAEKNLGNAHGVFRSYLEGVFSKQGEGWLETTLGEIAVVKGGKRVPKGYKLSAVKTPFPYLRVADFGNDGSIDLAYLKYIDQRVHEQIKNYIIKKEDLYVSIAGTIGKAGIIPKELDGAHLTENACRLVFKPGILNHFIYFFTQTDSFVAQAGLNTRTSAQPKLALSRLSTIKLSVPNIGDQKKLLEKFGEIRSETLKLHNLYSKKIGELISLKMSVLNDAFTGKL